ncbi:hypothetical protein [Leptospira stimsonii]|uniref:Uncharacterized protein n=1 Tax=Leptospira stimsonii TaxID=2202203 RepID=A0A4R9L3C7_9LEPT|nr:hypothetical protein [Leptospira stimsonii]RHX86713.1 hypothetical protein DLM78_13120 [Leptospira stimsonii]TGK13298.1 hypothetical protein EHO98_18350 [Leptospira stimsonii]TGM09075.1 hypothetical protein EHQ90_21090 [Leptospira stimsonii]
MESIRRWSGGLFLFGIALNLLCASSMNLSGTCPIGISKWVQAVSSDSVPPCHRESSSPFSSDSSSPCCSSEVVKADSSLEFRIEIQKFFSPSVILILFFMPMESILNPMGQTFDKNRRETVFLSDLKKPISVLQVFLI